MTRFLLFLSSFILLASDSFSQDSTAVKGLEEVVVTGQYKPQSMRSSVYQVKVINSERIRRQGATNLQDVLSNELNIRFNQDLATGGSDITMMGLKGQNVKILIDGMPMVGRQGTSNEINISQIDINSIERIEIVEGPMSVVYGADALAGVINIITKKARVAKFSITARLHEETVGNEFGAGRGIHNQHVGVTFRKNRWEAGGSFSHNYFGGWKDSATGRELVWHKKDQLIANGFIGYNNGRFNIRYRIDGLDEIITNPGNFLFYQSGSGETLARDQEYLSQRVMHQLQAGYFVNSNLNFQFQGAFSDYSRQVYSTTVSDKTGDVRLDLSTGSQSIVDFTGLNIRATAVYRVSPFLSFQPGVDLNMESGEGERLKQGNNEVNDYAFFLTSEYQPLKWISVRPGLRFIHNSVYDAPPVIPSINTRFQLANNLDLRLSYARGFRSPSLRELYFNFFDANHQITGNPDLMAETSHSFNGSLSWTKVSPAQVAYTTVLGGFYNRVKNLIDYAVSATDPNLFILTNVTDSKTAGISLTTMVKYRYWNISVGGSYTGFYNDLAPVDKSLDELQWSAEANTSIGYSLPKVGLDFNLFYKFTGKRPGYIQSGSDILRSELEGYHWADFTVNKKLVKYVTINAGVRNLFDVDRVRNTASANGVHTSTGARNIGYGRSWFAGIVFNWDKK